MNMNNIPIAETVRMGKAEWDKIPLIIYLSILSFKLIVK